MLEKQQKGKPRDDSCLLYACGQHFSGWKELHQNVIAVAAGQNHYIYLTAKQECYGVGSNRFGQLALDNQPSITVPTEIFGYPPLRNDVLQISCGAEHTFLLTSKGEVYSCGLNIKGQLGVCTYENTPKAKLVAGLLPHGEKNMKASNRELVKRPRPAIYGILESMQLLDVEFDLNVKTDGDEEYGTVPLLLASDESVEEVSCGALHTLVLSNKGRVFAAGMYNTRSNEQYSVKAEFHEVKLSGEPKSDKPSSKKVTAIACGLSTCAVLADGVPYIWGKLGKLSYNIPTAVQFKTDMPNGFHIFDVKAGDAFVLFLNSKGEVFTMGENLQGQLGNSEHFCDTPIKVQRLPLIKSIYAGRNYCLVVSSEDGMVYGWGANQHGQLGLNSQQNLIVQTPTPIGIRLKDGDRLVLGSFQTFLLKRDHLEQAKVESSSAQNTESKEEMISLKEYKKLQYEYQLLKNLNLSLIEKTQRPHTVDQPSQTPSKFQVSGISKYRTFNSNLQIDWKQLKLEGNISEGGYGVIYKAKWRQTIVAVKKFKIETGDVGVRDFLSECHAMEAVRHPNIVMFIGACTKSPNYAIVMEYCQRGSLWSLLQNPSIELKWEQRRRIALQIARAVHYLHMFNPPILHRDLKSLNILLDDNLHVRIADFGWTKTLDNYMTNKIGTYQWMAPEVIGEPKYSEKADVFSYSIILWEIASRQPPYKNINGQQVSQEVYNEDLRPILPKKTPEAFARLTTRCWQRDPLKRPTFRQIIHQLEAMKLPPA